MFYGEFGKCITLLFNKNFAQVFAFKFQVSLFYFRYGLQLQEVSDKDARNYPLGKLIANIYLKSIEQCEEASVPFV